MYTGDFGGGDNIYDRLVGFASSRGIPCAVAFGNHEPEDEKEREAVLNHFASLPGCLNVRKDAETSKLPGATNQIIPIYSSTDAGKKSAILYLFDSHCDHHLPGYDRKNDWIKPEQVEWYVRHSRALTVENGGVPYPALAFFHIPLLEYGEAWNDSRYKNMGWRIENEGCAPVNSGLFAAFLDCGDVKGVFCGHDHDPKDHPRAHIIYDRQRREVKQRSVEMIDNGSFLTFGGYGARGGYRPLSDKMYRIVFTALPDRQKSVETIGFYP